MDYALSAGLFTVALLLGMLFLLELGRRIGARRIGRDPGASTGIGAVDGAIFGLMGLLVAFTFSGAVTRFDARRQLIVEEANDVSTAYLRLDLLPANVQPGLRESFRRYVDARLAVYSKLPDLVAAKAELTRATDLQGEIWHQAVTACPQGAPPACMLLLPALNAMIDIATTRTMAAHIHPPTVIFAMLFGVALASSLLAGFGMAGSKSRNLVHMVGFAVVMAAAVFVILDIEFPRLGLIRVDAFDQVLVEVRDGMK